MLPILNQSYWRDEAFSILLSKKSPVEIIFLTLKDQSPPFYYLILHYWMALFGQSEVATRMLSFVFHIGLVITVFFICRKFINLFYFQITIAVVTLLNPFLLQYAFETRMYSLLAFLTVLSVYLIFCKRYWLSGAFLALGVLTHNFGVFNLIAVVLWWITVYRLAWKDHLKEGVILFILPFSTFVSWSFIIWNQWVRVGKGFWIAPVTSQIFLNAFGSFSSGDISYPTQYMLLLVSIFLLFFGSSYWFLKKEKEVMDFSFLLMFVVFIPIIITYLVSILFAPIYHQRYLISLVPNLIILIGYSIYKIYQEYISRQGVIIGFIFVYVALLILSSEQIVHQSTKSAINWSVSQILSQSKTGDIIIPKDVLNYLETKLYVEENNSNIPVYAYSPTGKIPYYIGYILFDKKNIITMMPKNRRIWQVMPSGGYNLVYYR